MRWARALLKSAASLPLAGRGALDRIDIEEFAYRSKRTLEACAGPARNRSILAATRGFAASWGVTSCSSIRATGACARTCCSTGSGKWA